MDLYIFRDRDSSRCNVQFFNFLSLLKYTPKQKSDRGKKDWIAKVKIIKRGIKGIRHRVTSQYQEREKRSKFQLSVVCLTNRHLADFQI